MLFFHSLTSPSSLFISNLWFWIWCLQLIGCCTSRKSSWSRSCYGSLGIWKWTTMYSSISSSKCRDSCSKCGERSSSVFTLRCSSWHINIKSIEITGPLPVVSKLLLNQLLFSLYSGVLEESYCLAVTINIILWNEFVDLWIILQNITKYERFSQSFF